MVIVIFNVSPSQDLVPNLQYPALFGADQLDQSQIHSALRYYVGRAARS